MIAQKQIPGIQSALGNTGVDSFKTIFFTTSGELRLVSLSGRVFAPNSFDVQTIRFSGGLSEIMALPTSHFSQVHSAFALRPFDCWLAANPTTTTTTVATMATTRATSSPTTTTTKKPTAATSTTTTTTTTTTQTQATKSSKTNGNGVVLTTMMRGEEQSSQSQSKQTIEIEIEIESTIGSFDEGLLLSSKSNGTAFDSNSPTSGVDGNHDANGLVIGASIGGVIVLLLLLFGCGFLVNKRRRDQQRRHDHENGQYQPVPLPDSVTDYLDVGDDHSCHEQYVELPSSPETSSKPRYDLVPAASATTNK